MSTKWSTATAEDAMGAMGLPVTISEISLRAGERTAREQPQRESAVVILGGSCDIEFPGGGPSWTGLGDRPDVFDGKATTVYAPAGRRWQVTAGLAGAHLAVLSATASTDRAPYLVSPDQVKSESRGTGVWQREVHDIISPAQPADSLLVGETFSDAGVWSSYPPHKHDRHDPPNESLHQESFYVRVSPQSGFGLFIHYPTTDADREVTVVQDGDIVAVESGYHSFAVAAGHRFYYLWALAGSHRELHFNTDPRHRWLLNQGEPT